MVGGRLLTTKNMAEYCLIGSKSVTIDYTAEWKTRCSWSPYVLLTTRHMVWTKTTLNRSWSRATNKDLNMIRESWRLLRMIRRVLNPQTNNFHARTPKLLKMKKFPTDLTKRARIAFLIHRKDWLLANEAHKKYLLWAPVRFCQSSMKVDFPTVKTIGRIWRAISK